MFTLLSYKGLFVQLIKFAMLRTFVMFTIGVLFHPGFLPLCSSTSLKLTKITRSKFKDQPNSSDGDRLVTKLTNQNQSEVIDQLQEFIIEDNLEAVQLRSIHYYLWTRSNLGDADHYSLQYKNRSSFESSPFDSSRKTYIYFHGYNSHGLNDMIVQAKSLILKSEDVNFISVDYEHLVGGFNYFLCVINMYKVANHTASFIDWMGSAFNVSAAETELVGYSLGAHAAGMTAKSVTSGLFSRITGIDPAGPEFVNISSDKRLDKSHANFVDVIHSNSCPYAEGCYGLQESIGHIDFYPNGGEHQAGCVKKSSLIGKLQDFAGCSHYRASLLWLESIVLGPHNGTSFDKDFKSWPCKSWKFFDKGRCRKCGKLECPKMGLYVNRKLRGSYYLRTAASSPFARGDSQK